MIGIIYPASLPVYPFVKSPITSQLRLEGDFQVGIQTIPLASLPIGPNPGVIRGQDEAALQENRADVGGQTHNWSRALAEGHLE